MSVFQIELTEKQWEIVEEVWANVEQETAYLSTLSQEQRLAWFREHQYPHPISFEREIGGTGYTVNAHFSKFCAGCGMIRLPCNSYHIRLRKGAYFEEKAA